MDCHFKEEQCKLDMMLCIRISVGHLGTLMGHLGTLTQQMAKVLVAYCKRWKNPFFA